jgi:glyoxylase-like metal-dependent hydrolase (beta-lactamase superfamily II)
MTRIHRVVGSPDLIPVNGYLVEGPDGVVAVDGTLTASGGRELRRRLLEIGKPLAAVLVTHAHPDHYGGLVELVAGDAVDVWAVAGVIEALRRDDAAKDADLRGLLGDEWPQQRLLPGSVAQPGRPLSLAGMTFDVLDLGPGESPHDSVWLLGDDRRVVFAGDEIYHHVHAYMAEGMPEEWLGQIAVLERELPDDAVLYPGHGEPASPALLAWQAQYVRTFTGAMREADWSAPEQARASVLSRMAGFLATDELRILLDSSIEPAAVKLGLQ